LLYSHFTSPLLLAFFFLNPHQPPTNHQHPQPTIPTTPTTSSTNINNRYINITTMATTAMNTHRFGSVVQDPDIVGVEDSSTVVVPFDLAEQMERAIRDGEKALLEPLISRLPAGAVLSTAATTTGDSLLHIAAQLGHFKCAGCLIEQGGMDVSLPLTSKSKMQPIHYAAKGAHTQCVAFLVSKGADKDARTVDGETPFHLLAKRSSGAKTEQFLACMNELLRLGADINARDNSERTPLHVAAANGDVEIARALLTNGAYVDTTHTHTHSLSLSMRDIMDCI
jgi:hypothetical protein